MGHAGRTSHLEAPHCIAQAGQHWATEVAAQHANMFDCLLLAQGRLCIQHAGLRSTLWLVPVTLAADTFAPHCLLPALCCSGQRTHDWAAGPRSDAGQLCAGLCGMNGVQHGGTNQQVLLLQDQAKLPDSSCKIWLELSTAPQTSRCECNNPYLRTMPVSGLVLSWPKARWKALRQQLARKCLRSLLSSLSPARPCCMRLA